MLGFVAELRQDRSRNNYPPRALIMHDSSSSVSSHLYACLKREVQPQLILEHLKRLTSSSLLNIPETRAVFLNILVGVPTNLSFFTAFEARLKMHRAPVPNPLPRF